MCEDDLFAEKSFEDLVSACSSMDRNASFSESSAHMESIPEGNQLADTQVVFPLFRYQILLKMHLRLQ